MWIPAAEGEIRLAAQEYQIVSARRPRVKLELMVFDRWAEVVGFLASPHAQGRGCHRFTLIGRK